MLFFFKWHRRVLRKRNLMFHLAEKQFSHYTSQQCLQRTMKYSCHSVESSSKALEHFPLKVYLYCTQSKEYNQKQNKKFKWFVQLKWNAKKKQNQIIWSTYLVNHDDEPVPVLTQRPELFVLLSIFSLLICICKCETRADCVSPINTSFNAKYGRIRLTLARYFFWSASLSTSVGYSFSSIGVGSHSWRSNDTGKLPFWPNVVVRIRVRCNHSNSPFQYRKNVKVIVIFLFFFSFNPFDLQCGITYNKNYQLI